jgi:formate dehydrogenase major subunit
VAPGEVFTSFHFPDTQTNALTSQFTDVTGCPEYKVTAVALRRRPVPHQDHAGDPAMIRSP